MKPKRSQRFRTLSRPQYQAARALAKFHPGKRQVGKFVFVGLNGKVLPRGSQRKGVMVYVYQGKGRGKPLKYEPIREGKRKPLVPRRESGFDVMGTGKKAAIAAYKARRKLTHISTTSRLRSGPKERRGVDYTRFTARIAKDLKRFTGDHPSRGQYVIDIEFTVKLPNGKTRSFSTSVGFSERERQMIKRQGYEHVVRTKVYAFIAEELSRYDLVTRGSAAYIRSINDSDDPGEWETKSGQEWGKGDFEQVTIAAMSYKISRLGR